MNNKFVCIHGHFYQPPRENPWLETIEIQESAAPFHDWNERINFECYACNATARILDSEDKIINIINNYAKISFNFGPTLLSWMETADPTTYQLIQEADVLSRKTFGGHGSAVAQAHSHLILPLCNRRDKETQVLWGIRDFEHRFKRFPEGMWCAETAVNTETLEVMADYGIKYTILAPRQAKNFRKIGENHWTGTYNDNIETRRPYLCKLPNGKSIALFFYNGGVSQAVAFEGLLKDGKGFGQRLTSMFTNNNTPELIHVATDGESYGHHHRFGDMALASCVNYIEDNSFAQLINYGQYLEMFPPEYEAEIHENSSWSCVHGIERWRSDCGCNTGGSNAGHQKWRGPLRNALNWLRDQLAPIFEGQARMYVRDPWAARNGYIDLLLNRKTEISEQFISKYAVRELTDVENTHLFRLMEMQRNALLMYTSCGWFFDEVSGLENTQILKYACRAIHYARQVANVDFEPEFTYRLAQAPSNLPEIGDGGNAYTMYVRPAHVDLVRVGMHYAVSSMFERYPRRLELFNYVAQSDFFERVEMGGQWLVLGRTMVRSKITLSEKHFSFAVLYLGELNLIGNISLDMDRKTFDEMYQKTVKAFKTINLADVIGAFQTYFGPEKFTIWQLFKEEKQKIIDTITAKNLKNVEGAFRKVYEDNYRLMTGLLVSNVNVPEAYKNAVSYVLNLDLKAFFEKEALDISELQNILGEIKKWNVGFSDAQAFKLAAVERIFQEVKKIQRVGIPLTRLQSLIEVLTILNDLNVKADIWKSQNVYFSLLKRYENKERQYPNADWRRAFLKLGDLLKVKTEVDVYA
jgi:alpha-amylase/alpha-mannosidase (GH57 family)